MTSTPSPSRKEAVRTSKTKVGKRLTMMIKMLLGVDKPVHQALKENFLAHKAVQRDHANPCRPLPTALYNPPKPLIVPLPRRAKRVKHSVP